MAMAMLITPSSRHPPQPSFSSDYHHSSSGASISNMISSVQPQKPANGLNSSNRQPLPSISELIQNTKPSPSPPTSPSNTQPGSNLSSSFAAVPRSFLKAEKHSLPQLLRPASSFPPQQDALTFFTGSRRPPFTSRLLLPPISDRQAGPSAKPNISPQQHHPQQQRPPRPHHPLNGVHAHRHPPPPPARVAYKPGQQPPGQMRLPASPISPKHAVLPHASKPYNPWAPPHTEKGVYAPRARYDTTVNRHFEIWSYQEYLSQIGSCSHTVLSFSKAYSLIAQEQHGAHPIPDRLPTERDISDMLANIELIKRYLEQVRGLVQTSSQNERAREAAKMKDLYEEAHDVPMYGDAMKPQYGMTEVKTRWSHAVPLDKCHRCNRIDTPEWRRGPDGARTLCNACGLRYVKLKKKQQLEARRAA
ncbi:hypothetical protein B0J13DRAFT_649664 [Dactylonectria estremocensis]|uniref:GATA-type domain-containing protein n=1 Tax=Dactylonectria estremocensis TaxID=1079267 RepID=A0A9P9II56_9HYPO|nr:hypothetical protein B0J13DRAFT_649664 [Dactylonectria estremocensis]